MPDSEKKLIIELKGVSKSYLFGEVETTVLKSISFRITEGELVAIFGPSGSGKTTLLNLIGGLDRPSEGSVSLLGKDISGMNNRELAKFRYDHIGFVFQFYNLLPTLSAAENVAMALELAEQDPKKISGLVRESLEMVGLGGKEDRFPSQLSGGQQQRVALARALVKKPKILLADEPTGNLDENTAAQVIQLMLQLHKKTGSTMLIVTHNEKIAQHANQVIRIHNFHEEIFKKE